MSKAACLFLILAQVELSVCGYDCILNCTCELTANNLLLADCTKENFTEVPDPSFKYRLHVLLLQFNQITKIRGDDFDYFDHLEVLDLRRNGLATIEENAFSGLKRLRKLDLSDNNLLDFPWSSSANLASTLTSLSLARNVFGLFPAEVSTFEKLELFDISGNRLDADLPTGSLPKSLKRLKLHHTGLRIHSLVGLKSLEYVDLSGCVWNTTSDALSDMHNLTTLLLSNSNLTEPPLLAARSVTSYPVIRNIEGSGEMAESTTFEPGGVTWYNPVLDVLDLSNNPLMTIETGRMIFPPFLVDLNLARTKVHAIDEHFFEHALSIEHVDLSYSNVATISPNAFQVFYNLTELSLSGNPLEFLPRLPGSLTKLSISGTGIQNLTKNSFFSLTAVTEVDISNGRVQMIEDYSFGSMLALEKLDLSGNKIEILKKNSLRIGAHVGAIHSQPSLCDLDISHGLLASIESGAFVTLGGLETLNLEDNKLNVIYSGTFDGLKNLESLDLRQNSILDLQPAVFKGMKKLKILHLESNQLEVVHARTLDGLSNLEELHLEDNNLVAIHFSPLHALLLLNVANNNLSSFPEVLSQNIQYVDASHNPITTLDAAHFRNLGKVQNLNLSHCHLRMIQYKSVFMHTASLTKLDLTGNNISNFLDVSLPSLRTLLMAGNCIESIHITLKSILPNIEILDLRKNILSRIGASVFKGMQSLKKVDFSGKSNFRCDCNLAEFIRWVQAHESSVVGSDLYKCAEPSGHRGQPVISTINSMQCETVKATKPARTGIYVVIGIVIVVFSAIIFAFLIRRLRKNRRNINDGDRACWCFGKIYAWGGDRVPSEEGLDLVEYMSSPIDKDAPVSM